MPRRASREAGFIITLEMIIIFTILGIGLLAGIFAVRNALFVWLAKKQAQTVLVFDSSDPRIPLGPARDFDEHEAPRLFYIDRDVTDWGGQNYRAFIGVRDDRFTSRHRIFYTDSLDCGANFISDNGDDRRACITSASTEVDDNLGVGSVSLTVDGTTSNGGNFAISQQLKIDNAGGQGYLYALQQGPTYGVGADVDQTFNGQRLPGTLYRQTENACTDNANDIQIRSVWTSQLVTDGEPCEPLPEGIVVNAAKCPPGQAGGSLGSLCTAAPNVDGRCVTSGTCSINGTGCAADSECPALGETCDENDLQCACPETANGTLSDNWFEIGANCCPPGTTDTTGAGQCVIGGDGILFQATPVELAGVNAFSFLAPPFVVNLPPDDADFTYLNPSGTEGAAGSDSGIPYQPADYSFDRAPDGE